MAGNREEGPVTDFLANLGASVLFAAPTAFLFWFGINGSWSRYFRVLLPDDFFLSTGAGWLMFGLLVIVGVVFPKLFPGIMGFFWRLFLRICRWFPH